MPSPRPELTSSQAAAALARACPGTIVAGIRPLHQGYSGQHWLFETDEGELLLRTSTIDGPEHLRHLISATRQAADAGVPVVRFRSFVPHDPETDGPLLVQEFGPGRSASDAFPELSTEQRASVGAELGEVVARLHLRHGTAFSDALGRAAFPSATAWALDQLEDALPVVRDVRIEAPWDKLAEQVRTRLQVCGPARPTLLHRDLYLDNVLLTAGPTPRIAAILDFERARYGDQFEDFGKLDETVFGWWPETKQPFLDAYSAVHPISSDEEHRIHAYVGLYNITMMAHFVRGEQWQIVPDYVERVAHWLTMDDQR